MRLIIAGSRTITDYNLLRTLVLRSKLWEKYGKKLEVISGMAKGVDTLGVEFAQKAKLKLWEFPVTHQDWSKHGKSAGHIRNRRMGDFAKLCPNGGGLLALWDGESNGTKGMIDYARALGLAEVHPYKCQLMWAMEEI